MEGRTEGGGDRAKYSSIIAGNQYIMIVNFNVEIKGNHIKKRNVKVNINIELQLMRLRVDKAKIGQWVG